ncbi:MAG: hypothetical protein ACFB16_10455 [Phormidesmis sp.]
MTNIPSQKKLNVQQQPQPVTPHILVVFRCYQSLLIESNRLILYIAQCS